MKITDIDFCCEDLKSFCTTMDRLYLRIGEGEISGSVSLETWGGLALSISDGWNSIPRLEFKFCPYCGEKVNV